MTIDYSKYEGHTPGPWFTVEDHSQQDELGYGPTGVAISKYSDDVVDAIAWMQEGSNQDAELIADAPMLLERCKRLETALELIRDPDRVLDDTACRLIASVALNHKEQAQ